MATDGLVDTVGQLDDDVGMEKATMGGSAETEITEVAVKPTGRSRPGAVMTATPEACLRKNSR